MNSLKVIGKYLDQPIFLKKFSSRAVPALLLTGGAALTYKHVNSNPPEKQKKEFIKSLAVLTGTIASALLAPKLAAKSLHGIDKIFHSLKKCGSACHHHHHEHEHSIALVSMAKLKEHNTKLINTFFNENQVNDTLRPILTKAKETQLNPKEIKTLFESYENDTNGKKLLSKIIPEPEDIDSNHIFKEDVKRLSILGLIPVLGGIAGGIAGDKLTDKNWKRKVPDKINEGAYQYLANIFLCNIGAGAALFAMEKAKIKNKAVRAGGMIGGIIVTGIIFGSALANLFGQKIIDPLLGTKHKAKLYEERKPDALDLSLHIDDIATVAVLSGLKWIEPALPILYSVSGYRAGIGYRNGQHHQH